MIANDRQTISCTVVHGDAQRRIVVARSIEDSIRLVGALPQCTRPEPTFHAVTAARHLRRHPPPPPPPPPPTGGDASRGPARAATRGAPPRSRWSARRDPRVTEFAQVDSVKMSRRSTRQWWFRDNIRGIAR